MLGIERIQVLYKALELNRKSFCNKIGIGYQALTNMERRKSDPSFKLLQSIKERFPQVNIDWLLLEKGEMFISEKEELGSKHYERIFLLLEESNKAYKENSELLREKVLLLEKERYDDELTKCRGK